MFSFLFSQLRKESYNLPLYSFYSKYFGCLSDLYVPTSLGRGPRSCSSYWLNLDVWFYFTSSESFNGMNKGFKIVFVTDNLHLFVHQMSNFKEKHRPRVIKWGKPHTTSSLVIDSELVAASSVWFPSLDKLGFELNGQADRTAHKFVWLLSPNHRCVLWPVN